MTPYESIAPLLHAIGFSRMCRDIPVHLLVIFLSMICPILFGLRCFMAFEGATPPLHPLHASPQGTVPPLILAGKGSFDSAIMAPLMQQNVYPFTPSPPHPQAHDQIAHGPAMPSEVYPQLMHSQVPYRDSFSSYGQTASPSGLYNPQYAESRQRQ
ncbi:hypothetical protein cyc_06115 [Cyclospora cayetanensis]|uniref:Uncharacterized protein n=1 Tax=Cyclospora cayetanensis TaxID=88456 RepID=A0A1D3D429_9EIME|nr:hypothetical protein cyc_06115 [Cyclospora cayetanensis]